MPVRKSPANSSAKRIKRRVKVGDIVQVLAGKDKGRQGKIVKVLPTDRVVVEGVNMMRKHVKPDPQKNVEGGIISREAALHISNVALYNDATGKTSRVGYKFLEDNTKVRYFKDNGEVVDV